MRPLHGRQSRGTSGAQREATEHCSKGGDEPSTKPTSIQYCHNHGWCEPAAADAACAAHSEQISCLTRAARLACGTPVCGVGGCCASLLLMGDQSVEAGSARGCGAPSARVLPQKGSNLLPPSAAKPRGGPRAGGLCVSPAGPWRHPLAPPCPLPWGCPCCCPCPSPTCGDS